MKSLSSIGLGLTIVFCCLLLALVVEVYYLLWWKKRIMNSEIENDNHGNPMKDFFYMFCYKRQTSSTTSTTSSMRHTTCFTSQELCSSMIIGDNIVHDLEAQQVLQSSQSSKEFLFKPFGDENNGLHHPRLLFTIVEESKEDLESEDGRKSRKGSSKGKKSLSDLLVVETPYLTPNTSPSFFTPNISAYNNQHGLFNPLFESTTDAEFNRMKSSSSSSPPPKFKFLQEAEEKLRRKLQDENNKR